jgi:sulfate adenylyltransferase subunit 1 (EFTu-like GTPase family)
VQWVIRPQSDEYHDFRGFAGRVASGTFKVGDEVTAYPAGMSTRITGIHTADGDQQETVPMLSYSLTLADEIDISRGDLIAKTTEPPEHSPHIDAMICWFTEKPLKPRGRYYLRHTTRTVRASIPDLLYKVNISTMERVPAPSEFGLNDIGCIRLRCASPLYFDSYANNRTTGSFVLVDEQTNSTVAAGMILRAVGDENTKSPDEFAI